MLEEIMNLINEGYTIIIAPSADAGLLEVTIMLGDKQVAWDYGLLPDALTDAYMQVPEKKPE